MKITRIRDAVAPIPSPMRNSVISFDKMTISIVAIETDVVRNGKPVIGLGFCSNGRYAQPGIIRDRLVPRDHGNGSGRSSRCVSGANLCHAEAYLGGHDAAMKSLAVTATAPLPSAAIDMAVWDARRQDRRPSRSGACSRRPPQPRRTPQAQLLVYSGGGYYYPDDEKAGPHR